MQFPKPAARHNRERINECAPNLIELSRNFRYRIDITSEEKYQQACSLFEELELGSSNPKPGDNIDYQWLHVHYGYEPMRFRDREFKRADCAAWISEKVNEDVRECIAGDLGELIDVGAMLAEQAAERQRREREYNEARQRRQEIDFGRRPAFDRHDDIRYQSAARGNDGTASEETPVIIFLDMAAKPKMLKPFGKPITWRMQGDQRLLQCASEEIGLKAIDALKEHIQFVVRGLHDDTMPFFVSRRSRNALEGLPITPSERHPFQSIGLSDDDAVMVRMRHPNIPIHRTLYGQAQ